MRRTDPRIAGWRGAHNVLPPDDLPEGYVADALDGFFDVARVFEALPATTDRGGPDLIAVWRGPLQLALSADGTLYRLDHLPAEPLRTGLTGDWLAAVAVGPSVYLSDGRDLLLIEDGAARPWTVPAPQPQVSPIDGAISPGQYQLAVTWVLDDGRESGCEPLVLTLAQPSGLLLRHGAPVPEGAAYARVYATATDGTALYQRGAWAADRPEYRLLALGEAGATLDTGGYDAIPPGQCVGAWGARLAVAVGADLYLSPPYLPHLADLALTYRMEHPITALWDCDAGLVVGTTAGLFLLSGQDASAAPLLTLSRCGVLLQNPTPIDAQQLRYGDGWLPVGVLLVSRAGVLHVADSGQATLLTADVYQFPTGERATGAVMPFPGGSQFLFTIEE
ncbi:hypothetical protein [Chitiniphilus eburneus]|uniref:Uncharacterized protein n=1 Tax=Chitiniphilus eburneus TaxID=2571148 RepID=A0A4U0PGR0_9NEIS|nr:hypothetical protein [Chitiniphilus eburneus]TJZ67123.1 hypothetical protein FAZ21_16460 [Chitiniphilus eburneus]